MKIFLKIIGEFIIGFGFLFGLYRGGIIDQASAITIGLLAVVFILCFEELKKNLHPIQNATAEIQAWLAKEFKFVALHEVRPVGFVKERSPVDITEIGQKLLNESGAKKVVDDNYPAYETAINQGHCQTAYDVQVKASQIIAQAVNETYMKPIKDFVYNNPKFNDIPLGLSDVQRVMVVYLRNLYLGKYPNILPEDKPKKS